MYIQHIDPKSYVKWILTDSSDFWLILYGLFFQFPNNFWFIRSWYCSLSGLNATSELVIPFDRVILPQIYIYFLIFFFAVFVTKNKQNSTYNENEKNTLRTSNMAHIYKVVAINLRENSLISDLSVSSEKQTMVQFLYRKKPNNSDRFLIFTHLKSKW